MHGAAGSQSFSFPEQEMGSQNLCKMQEKLTDRAAAGVMGSAWLLLAL